MCRSARLCPRRSQRVHSVKCSSMVSESHKMDMLKGLGKEEMPGSSKRSLHATRFDKDSRTGLSSDVFTLIRRIN
jgi:hypothetical protein